MNEQPRDWDREMADIDRAIAKQGSVPPAGAPPAGAPMPAPVPGARPPAPVGVAPAPPPGRRRSVALTWFWTLLAVALGVALPLWPYQRACGLQLFFFLGAATVTAVIAILGALASWSNRRGFAHLLSLAVLLWAGAVALREVLPRVGYAKASRTWMCPTEPVVPARTPPGTAQGTASPAQGAAPDASAP